MARPSVTDPPGELMYTEMSRSWCSASRRISCEQTRLAVFWSMADPMKTMRSLSSRWKMSAAGPSAIFIPGTAGVSPSSGAAGSGRGEGSRGAPMRPEPTAWGWRSGGGPGTREVEHEVDEAVGRASEVELGEPAAAGGAQPFAALGVGEQAGDGAGHPARAAVVDEHGGVRCRLLDGSRPVGHHRQTVGHGLDQGDAEPLVLREHDEDVGRRVVGRQLGLAQPAPEGHRGAQAEL